MLSTKAANVLPVAGNQKRREPDGDAQYGQEPASLMWVNGYRAKKD